MAHRNHQAGRRGRKFRKQEARQERKRDLKAQALRVEHDKRKKLIEWVKPIITKVCELSSVGIAIDKRTEVIGDKYPRELFITKLCCEGEVNQALWDVDEIEIRNVKPWHEISSHTLAIYKEMSWKPLWPKNILDRLAEI